MILAGYLVPIFIQVIFGFIFFQQFHFLAQRERLERKTCCKLNAVCSCCMQHCITAAAVVALNIGKGRKLYPRKEECKQYHKTVIKYSLVTYIAQFTCAY